MALHVPAAQNFAQMLKDGTRTYTGIDETVLRNIEAVKTLVKLVKSSYGPNGLNKIIVNHINKQFVTNHAATIVKEVENDHPGVKLIILAAEMQQTEIGDGTNFVLLFAGFLLEEAEGLLRMGLSIADIVEGYEMAAKKAVKLLPSLTIKEVTDLKDIDNVRLAVRASVMSKQYGYEDFLASLITQACVALLPEDGVSFDVDNVRMCKIRGGGVLDSRVVQGMVFRRDVEGTIRKKTNARVACFSCPIDIAQTETKGTVLIKNADQLRNYSNQEDQMLRTEVKKLKDAGVQVIVAGGKFGDLALHYIEEFDMMAVRLTSKWDLRRIAKACNATVLPQLAAPSESELGRCDNVYVDEIGEDAVVIFRQNSKDSAITSILIRGATDNVMDDVERALDDGINSFKALTKDGRLLAGAGAVELELAKELKTYGDKCTGLEQYAINKFAVALENFPKLLAENAGQRTNEVLTTLQSAHQKGSKSLGVNIEDEAGTDAGIDAAKNSIYDLFLLKQWGLQLAVDSAVTLLRVNQIVMAKPAGGPKPPQENKNWDADD